MKDRHEILSPEDEDLRLMKKFSVIDLEELFRNSPNAKIVNSETLISSNIANEFTSAIYQNADGDLGFAPTCKCGFIHGAANKGLLCPRCDTVCSGEFIDSLAHLTWLGIPQSLPPVLHPIWYVVLKQWSSIGKKTVSVIDLILDPEKEMPEDLAQAIPGKGFRYLYENFDQIMQFLMYEYPKTAKKSSTDWMKVFYTTYRDRAFTTKIPVLHSSLHPIKKNGATLRYADGTSKEILEAVIDLSNIAFRMHATVLSPKQINKAMYRVYSKIISYHDMLVKKKLGGKTAMIRKHLLGSRCFFSCRAVIVPQSVCLPMDEVVMPWAIMLISFKNHILNFLTQRYGYAADMALEIWFKALNEGSRLIEEILRTIISEFKDGKVPIAIGRNPTLQLLSLMKMFVSRFKTDLADQTMSINACIVKPSNADFDGRFRYRYEC